MTDLPVSVLVPPRSATPATRDRSGLVLAAPAVLVLLGLFVLPLALLLSQSLIKDGSLSLDAYGRLLGDAYGRSLAWNSIRLGLLTTGITLAIGYPAAFGLALSRGAWRSLFLASLFLPLAASVIVKAFSWTILLRAHGAVNEALLGLHLIDRPIRMVFTQTALIVGAVNVFLPFMILPIYAVVAQIDPRLTEAAATLGASPMVAFFRVTGPLSVPGVVAGVALVFSLSASAYVVPNLLMGENYPTLASAIAKAFLLARDPALGAAAGVILMLIGLAVVVMSSIGADRKATREHPAIRTAARAAMGLSALFLLLPLAVVAAVSLSPSPVFDLPTGGVTLRWYGAIGGLDGFWPALALSLEIAILSTGASLVLGTLAGLAIARDSVPGARTLAAALVSPLMMPGLVLGIALLQFFRGLSLTAAWPALLMAHVVVTLPYVARTVIAGLSRFDFTMVEAARTLGCSFAGALTRVMIPALAPAYLTAGLFAFLASMDNYPVSIFLTDAYTKTLPIKMLQYVDESPDPSIAALSTLILLATLILLVVVDRAVGLHRLAGLAE